MKILHLLTGFYPTRGGIETLVDSLAKELKCFHSVDSVFVAPRYWNSRPDRLTHEGTPVYSLDITVGGKANAERLLKNTRQAIKLTHQLEEILEIEKPDILHIHGVYEFFMLGNRLAQKLHLPVVNHIHGELTSSISPEHQELLRNAKCVIAVSDQVAQSFGKLEPRFPAQVIPNGVADLEPRPPINAIKRIALCGRLEEQKGFDIALQAISELKTNGFLTDVDLVGIGNHQYLQRESNRLGIDHQVTFHGRCSHDQTVEIIRNSDLVIVPSTSIEGFSLVAAEASLMQIPVIASRVGGLARTVKHDFSGLLFEPYDVEALANSVKRYISDIDLANLHGKNGRTYILEEFSLGRYASQMLSTYLALLENPVEENC